MADDSVDRLYEAEAGLKASYSRIGDQIAKQNGWSAISGLDAVYRWLVERHHWTLEYCRRMSVDDLTIVLAGDPWKAPKQKR